MEYIVGRRGLVNLPITVLAAHLIKFLFVKLLILILPNTPFKWSIGEYQIVFAWG